VGLRCTSVRVSLGSRLRGNRFTETPRHPRRVEIIKEKEKKRKDDFEAYIRALHL